MFSPDLIASGKQLESYLLQQSDSKALCSDFSTLLLTSSLIHVPVNTYTLMPNPQIRIISDEGAVVKWLCMQFPSNAYIKKRFYSQALSLCEYIEQTYLPCPEKSISVADISSIVENFCTTSPLSTELLSAKASIDILLLPATARVVPLASYFSVVITPKTHIKPASYTIIVPAAISRPSNTDMIKNGIISTLSVCLCDTLMSHLPDDAYDNLLPRLQHLWENGEDGRNPPSVEVFLPAASARKCFATWLSAIYKPVAAHFSDIQDTILDREVERVINILQPQQQNSNTKSKPIFTSSCC